MKMIIVVFRVQQYSLLSHANIRQFIQWALDYTMHVLILTSTEHQYCESEW